MLNMRKTKAKRPSENDYKCPANVCPSYINPHVIQDAKTFTRNVHRQGILFVYRERHVRTYVRKYVCMYIHMNVCVCLFAIYRVLLQHTRGRMSVLNDDDDDDDGVVVIVSFLFLKI